MKRSPTSHSYFSKRLRLHYLDWGNEDAPPLLMIHGNRDHCHNWDWMADRLADEYHILAPDLRGHGDSQWSLGSAYAISEFVYDIAQLVRQTRTAPVRIVAHSLGGNVSLQYAGVFPDEVVRLVSIEGYGRPAGSRRPPPAEVLQRWIELGRAMSGRSPRRYRRWMRRSSGCRRPTRTFHRSRPVTSPSMAATKTRTAPTAGSSITTCTCTIPGTSVRDQIAGTVVRDRLSRAADQWSRELGSPIWR